MPANNSQYAYMCHYYANPLSVLLSSELDNNALSAEVMEIVRCLPSFCTFIETAVETGNITEVRSLLNDDARLCERLQEQQTHTKQWVLDVLRNVKILTAIRPTETNFVQSYLDAVAVGIDMSNEHKEFLTIVRRMPPSEAILFLTRALEIIQSGDASIGLRGWAEESKVVVTKLSSMLSEIETLQKSSDEEGSTLKSKYSGHNKVLRTTVIAQKVQLSRDTADLSDADKAYTSVIDRLVDHLGSTLQTPKGEDVLLHEAWLYDFKTPYKDIFIPRPRAVLERALSRPHDYLGCSCCKSGEGEIKPTLPATAIVYHLYRETGSLINVADLWSAFSAMVGEGSKDGIDERTALVLFYRALSELKAMGFVKQSRKKADHIAKLAWQGL
jgi:origin recognition complex subunit 3